MSEEKKNFRSVVGAKNVHLAIKKNNSNQWEKPVRVIGAGKITIKNSYAEGKLVGDMKTIKSTKKKTGVEVSAEISEYTNEIKVLLEGGKIIKGTYANSADDLGNNVALLYTEVYDDNSEKLIVVYNVPLRAENLSEADGGSEDIEYNKVTLSGTGVAIEIDGESYFSYELDTGAEDYCKDQADKWFEEVQLPLREEDVEDPEQTTVDVTYTGYTSGTVTDISVSGITFDSSEKKFSNVPKDLSEFTFKLDGTKVTATKNVDTWNFEKEITTVDVAYTGYTSGAVTEISNGITFDSTKKVFKGVPKTLTSFTFKLDSVQKTATKSGQTWSFA